MKLTIFLFLYFKHAVYNIKIIMRKQQSCRLIILTAVIATTICINFAAQKQIIQDSFQEVLVKNMYEFAEKIRAIASQECYQPLKFIKNILFDGVKALKQIQSTVHIYLNLNESNLDNQNQHEGANRINIIALGIGLITLFLLKHQQKPKLLKQKIISSLKLNKSILLMTILFLVMPCTLCCNPNCIYCSSSTCTQCLSGFFISGLNCPPCNQIANCASCNGYSCAACNYGYLATSPQTCTSCPTLLSNCQSCYFYYSGASRLVRCSQCFSRYSLNTYNQQCQSCSSRLPACLTCSNLLTCTACIDTTYMVNTLSQCQLCYTNFKGCYQCVPSFCTHCFDGYYLFPNQTCTFCNTTLQNCILCPAFNYCTKCVNSSYLIDVDHCIKCGEKFPHCETCTSTRCLTCQTDMYLGYDSICKCNWGSLVSGYCLNVPGCTSAILYNNRPHCKTCNQKYFTFNPGTVRCDCIVGIPLGSKCIDEYGCITMGIVNNKQVCIMCNVINHFSLRDGKCICDERYHLSKIHNTCEQICGDGILIYLSCDDGNTIDGDGCSSVCQVQNKFQCFNENNSTPSKCLYTLTNFKIELVEVDKITESNTAKFQFRIVNFNPFILHLNWEKMIILDIAQKHYVQSMGLLGDLLTIKVNYDENLQGNRAIVGLKLTSDNFRFPKSINLTFDMVSSGAFLVIKTYPSSTILSFVSNILFYTCTAMLLLLLISSCLHKMVGIETLIIFQVCAIAPFLVADHSIVLSLFDNLSLSNGFGKTFFYNSNDAAIQGQIYENMALPKTFIQNMFINEGFLLIVGIILLLGSLTTRVLNKRRYRRGQKKVHFLSVFCSNLIFTISLGLFQATCISINANNFRIYEQQFNGDRREATRQYLKIHPSLNTFALILMTFLIMFVSTLNLLVPATRQVILDEIKSKIIKKLNKQFQVLKLGSRLYLTFFICFHFFTLSLLASMLFFPNNYCIFALLLIIIPFSVYVFLMRPYQRFIDNLGLCVGHLTLILFVFGLSTKQYLWMKKMQVDLNHELLFSAGIAVMLLALVIISYFRLIGFCQCKTKALSQDKGQTPSENENVKQSSSIVYDFILKRFHKPLDMIGQSKMENLISNKIRNQLKNSLLSQSRRFFNYGNQ